MKENLFQGMRLALGVLAMAALLIAGGCAGGKKTAVDDAGRDLSAPIKPEDQYKITSDPTAGFFRYSPQQPAGPDQQVKKETRVELISKLAGFSKVKLPSGEVGYVDTADIGHLSPKEIADEQALIAAKQAEAAALANPILNNANIGNGGSYTPPPEAGRTEPLPVADPGPSTTPPPSTMFRY